MSEILRVQELTKRFSGVLAVDALSFSLKKGEVLAILGENGAGKSTLTKMICGALRPDIGKIFLEGQECRFASSRDAMQAGVAMVYQELSMIGGMSVAENIFMNRQPVDNIGFIKRRQMFDETRSLLKRFNLDISPATPVKQLSMGTQQLLEILKAVSLGPKVLILDEPTSSLTETETELLFDMIKQLKEESISFIYISHKLSEIFRIADRVLVMRDGRYISERGVDEVNEMDLVRMMVGREITDIYGHADENGPGKIYFKVSDLCGLGEFRHVSFELRRGEILGFAGLVGAGRTEMARALVGLSKPTNGSIELEGKKLSITGPSDAIKAGIAYITEDRKKQGLYLGYSITANLAAPNLKPFSRNGMLKKSRMTDYAKDQISRFNIATPSSDKKVGELSGGNQQKCLLSMWMGLDPKVMILDEPTRGVDVGARSEIYEKIREYAATGAGAVVISSDLPELIGLCDRIIVMCRGRVRGELAKQDFSEEAVIAYASGVR